MTFEFYFQNIFLIDSSFDIYAKFLTPVKVTFHVKITKNSLSVAAVTQAETQLANTSLNGIDLFNPISDDTTIPTVVESLNAQIEESCHSTNKPVNTGEETSTNLRIKREEEECKTRKYV